MEGTECVGMKNYQYLLPTFGNREFFLKIKYRGVLVLNKQYLQISAYKSGKINKHTEIFIRKSRVQ